MITNLMKLRQEHNLTSRQIADKAGLPLRVEYVAEIGGLIDKEDAHKIAGALSALTGKPYTLEALGLSLKKENA
jgi:hypothetical protein